MYIYIYIYIHNTEIVEAICHLHPSFVASVAICARVHASLACALLGGMKRPSTSKKLQQQLASNLGKPSGSGTAEQRACSSSEQLGKKLKHERAAGEADKQTLTEVLI